MMSFEKKYELWRRSYRFKNNAPEHTLKAIEWANAYKRDGTQPIYDDEREIATEAYPVTDIPREMYPCLHFCEGYIPPLVHYGLPISRDTLMEYAQRYRLIKFLPLAEAPCVDPDYDIITDDDYAASMVYTITYSQQHINKRLAPNYKVAMRFCHGCKYGVFTFFNNYDLRSENPPMKLMEEIANDLKEPLAWWLDQDCY